MTATVATRSRRVVTVLFGDLVGSTAIADQLGPDAWEQLLADWYARVEAIVRDHGGSLEKFIGDAVVAVFGSDAESENDAAAAVRAALALVAATEPTPEHLSSPLMMRVAVGSGDVVVRSGGSVSHGVGIVMNRAARLQACVEPGQVVVDLQTRALARGAFRLGPGTLVDAKGLRRPVRAWPVLGRAVHDDNETPFVNQTTVTAAFHEAIRRGLANRQGTVLAVTGEAGIGKTRITQMVLGRIGSTALTVDLSGHEAGAQLRALAAAVEGRPAEDLERLSDEELSMVWAGALRARSTELIVLDSRDRLSPGVVSAVEAVHRLRLPVVVAVLCRELDPRLPVDEQLEVARLADDHAVELFRSVAGTTPTGEISMCHGNPLFVQQIALLRLESPDAALPPSAAVLYGRRADALTGTARLAAAAVSAWGAPLRESALRSAVGVDEHVAEQAVRLLLTGGYIRRAPDGALLRTIVSDVVYEKLMAVERADVHRRLARIAGVDGSRRLSHLRQAWRAAVTAVDGAMAEETRVALAEALHAAVLSEGARGEPLMAASLAAEYAAVVHETPAAPQAQVLLTYFRAANGDLAGAIAHLDQLLAAPQDESIAVHLRLTRATATLAMTGVADEAEATSLRESADTIGDEHLRLRADMLSVLTDLAKGRMAEAVRGAYCMLEHVDRADVLGAAVIPGLFPVLLIHSDIPGPEARGHLDRLRSRIGSRPVLRAILDATAGLLAALLGDRAAAEDLHAAAAEVLRATGRSDAVAGLWEQRARALACLGDEEAAAIAADMARTAYADAGSTGAALRAESIACLVRGTEPSGGPTGDDETDLLLLACGAHEREAVEEVLRAIRRIDGAGTRLLLLHLVSPVARRCGAATAWRRALDIAIAEKGVR